jgi:hypothetical protein
VHGARRVAEVRLQLVRGDGAVVQQVEELRVGEVREGGGLRRKKEKREGGRSER